jgi:23S rRNA pseudouridine1911/1915/1917 synthase
MTRQAPEIRNIHLEVESGLGRIRLDEYLFARLGTLSRMYLRELVKTDQVLVNGEFANVGVRLRANDFVEVAADLSRGTSMQPEDIPLDIIYEDDAIIVVNKAAGMLVHPTNRDKNGTLLNALSFHLNERVPPQIRKETKKVVRPGLVHRLDRETSGLIVVAKTVNAHRRLAIDFVKKRVEKRYLALVDGVVEQDEGTVTISIGRFAEKKHWDVKTDGKASETRFRVVRREHDSTLLELEPVTGRTNQLRIHCAHIGHPIVGDVQRGGRPFRRLCLHAFHLSFFHPSTKERRAFEKTVANKFEED